MTAHLRNLHLLLFIPAFIVGCDGAASDDSAGGSASGGEAPSSNSTTSGGSTTSSAPTTSNGGAGGGSGGVDFTPGEVPTEAPAWVASLVPGVWSAVSMNTISDVDPAKDPAANPNYPNEPPWMGNTGQDALISAWCGGAIAIGAGSYSSLITFGGGHADYHGNEVYAFDLGTLNWARLSNPYPTPSFGSIDAYPDGAYPDGTPVPPHTTDRVGYHLGTNSFVTLEVERNNLGGYLHQVPYMFSLDQKKWRHGPENPSAGGFMGWSAFDTKRELFWMIPGSNGSDILTAFNPNGDNGDGTYGSWSSYATQDANLGSMAAYDQVNDILLVTHFRSSSEIQAIDVENPNDPGVQIDQTGTPPNLAQAHGWEWSISREAFIYWSGDDVFELRPTGDWKTAPWQWVNITNPANAVVPDYHSNGVFSRFGIVNYAGLEVAITVNSTRGQVYAFRLPT